MASQVGVDVAFASANHRADAIPVARGEHRQTPHAGSTQKPHQQGLSAIVGVVACGDSIRAHVGRSRAKGNPACRASTGLQIPAGRYRNACAGERDVKGPSEGFRRIEFGSACGAKSVIDSVRE